MLKNKLKLIAISSGGGHWTQILRLRPAIEKYNVTYVTVSNSYKQDLSDEKFYTISDATRWNKVKLVLMALQILRLLLRIRPDVILSTGAAPGYFALRLGKMLGARTIWIDSIANVEEMSLSGRMVKPYADLWLTQWEHLSKNDGPKFSGSVL